MTDRFNVDDLPARDNHHFIRGASFMITPCKLDKIARQNGEPTTFPLEIIWKNQQKASEQNDDEYSRSVVVDEFISDGLIYRDQNNRIGLTYKGRRDYCPE